MLAAAVAYRRDGDLEARRALIEAHLPLVRHIAHRFAGRGERVEDLAQVGALGLIAAVDRCDPDRAETLTPYVRRCVEGEIRRHLRDRCAVIRVPRRAQAVDAGAGGTSEVAFARAPLSIDDAEAEDLAARDDLDEVGVARALFASATKTLDSRERRVVLLRYFADLSQSEVGHAVGVSQVQVSRLLKVAIAKMRARLEVGAGPLL
jgi:RNA polymerase sigma-B factor